MTAENRVRSIEYALSKAPAIVTMEEAPGVVAVAELYRKYLDGTTVRYDYSVAIDGVNIPLVILPGGKVPTIAVAATDDNNTITFTVATQDDHQQPTADQLTVTSDDTAGAVGTLVVNDDTHGGVLTLTHAEGTVNVTFSDPSAPGVEDLVFNVVVGPGQTAALSGSAVVE